MGLSAVSASCSISELPSLGQLQVLKVHRVNDLAALLTQGTNLRWLEVAEAGGTSPGMMHCTNRHARHELATAATWSSKLQVFSIDDCLQLSEDALHNISSMGMSQLRWLRLRRWPCTELPHTVVRAPALLRLDLTASCSITQLPQELGNLVKLKWLILSGCSDLTELPHSTGNLQWLECLQMDGCSSLRGLPNSLGRLRSLTTLGLRDCCSLQALPDSVTQLLLLQSVNLYHCSSLRCLPAGFGDLALKYFDIGPSVMFKVPRKWIAKWVSSGKCRKTFRMSCAHACGVVHA